jgi:uncharacterized repeat protein (TIGR03803 family)
MNTNVKPFCLILASLSLAICAAAQTLTPLVNFSGGNGANPQAGLVAVGSMLYGTTYAGGSSNAGTVFAINANGGGFSNVYNFTGGNDGRGPQAGLILSSNMLYGTTELGGSSGNGTVFAVNTNGGGFTNVYSFNGGPDGADPESGLVLMSNTLYGTASLGGQDGDGSVFRVNTDGTAFTNIHSFSGGTNGANPGAGLVLSGATLYGTTTNGGSSSYGTVFRVNTDGSSPSNVYTFTGGSDGANPEAGLVLAGSTLYGTAYSGGGSFYDDGTVFSVNTNGGGFVSYPFDYTDGANPQAGLLLLGGTLYGTTANGGSDGWGTVFQINTNGGSFNNIYSFMGSSDGANPEAGLVLAGGALLGTAQTSDYGSGYGTVFALSLPGLAPTLNITLSGGQVTLNWTNAALSLQSASTVAGVFTNVPAATSPYTNVISGQQEYFRLKGN